MIPHSLKCPTGIIEDHFFLMEKPGLNISQLGIPYSVYQEEEEEEEQDGKLSNYGILQVHCVTKKMRLECNTQ